MADNKRGLGRGLSALLEDAQISSPLAANNETKKPTESLPIEFLHANPDQPRKYFDEAELQELAESIGEKGIIQPILVRKIDDEHYQIVAGERRWRAAGIARLHQVPVIIREYSDSDVAEIALIENVQRADLNPMEEALGYNDLLSRYGNTQEELSKIIGKSRSHIANVMRLLKLDPQVQDFVRDGKISFGHARALVTSEHQSKDALLVIERGMSVRELEQMLEKRRGGDEIRSQNTKKPRSSGKDADTKQLEQELQASTGMKVQIDHKQNGAGTLSISYKNIDDLDKICALLGK